MDPITLILDDVIRREGGYVDHPADKGGPTKFGITHTTLAKWRGRPVTADDVYRLSEAEARQIYRARYVVDPGYDGIRDQRLAGLVVDCGVLYGADGDDASKWLQEAANQLGAGLKVDGQAGPKTIAAVNALDPREMYVRVCALRLRKMGRVITDDARTRKRVADQALNAAGWSNRLADLMLT